MTAAKVSAYAIAAGVYLFAVGLVAGGIALAVALPSLLSIVFGVGLAGLGFLMRPRFGKPPKEDVVSRTDAPKLHELVDGVAEALGTKTVDIIVVNHAYNASWWVGGLPRKRVLTLGLPLLTALDPQERVALIAHELAHARNGDATRSFVVGGALHTIGEVYDSLMNSGGAIAMSNAAIVEWVVRGMLWLVARPVLGLYYVLQLLLLRDCQRAEYLADALSARIAGTAAEIRVDEKMLLASLFDTIAYRSLHEPEPDVFGELRTAIHTVPERELERRRQVARHVGTRLSATHPPTARRLELIESRPVEAGQLLLTDEASDHIDEELRPLGTILGRRIIDRYRDALYA
jgi:heat shock protein HtpX